MRNGRVVGLVKCLPLSLSVCLSGLNRNVLIIDLGSGEEFDVRPVFPKQKFDSSEQIERGREGGSWSWWVLSGRGQ